MNDNFISRIIKKLINNSKEDGDNEELPSLGDSIARLPAEAFRLPLAIPPTQVPSPVNLRNLQRLVKAEAFRLPLAIPPTQVPSPVNLKNLQRLVKADSSQPPAILPAQVPSPLDLKNLQRLVKADSSQPPAIPPAQVPSPLDLRNRQRLVKADSSQPPAIPPTQVPSPLDLRNLQRLVKADSSQPPAILPAQVPSPVDLRNRQGLVKADSSQPPAILPAQVPSPVDLRNRQGLVKADSSQPLAKDSAIDPLQLNDLWQHFGFESSTSETLKSNSKERPVTRGKGGDQKGSTNTKDTKDTQDMSAIEAQLVYITNLLKEILGKLEIRDSAKMDTSQGEVFRFEDGSYTQLLPSLKQQIAILIQQNAILISQNERTQNESKEKDEIILNLLKQLASTPKDLASLQRNIQTSQPDASRALQDVIVHLTKVVKVMAENPTVKQIIDQSKHVTVRDIKVENSVFSLESISGNVTNAINQLSNSQSSDKVKIKELLLQLQKLIESADNETLRLEDKADGLMQVQVLAEAEQKSNPEEKRTLERRALTFIRGMVAAIPTAVPTAAKLIEEFNKLLPAIATLMGLS